MAQRDREIERRGNGPKWSCQSASQNAAGRQFPVASDAGSILPPSSPSSTSLFTPSPERKSKRLNRLLNPLPRSLGGCCVCPITFIFPCRFGIYGPGYLLLFRLRFFPRMRALPVERIQTPSLLHTSENHMRNTPS